MSDTDPTASARRVATRALLLTAPLLLVAFGVPRVVKLLRGPGAPGTSPLPVLAPPAMAEEKPRPPEAPTPEQIEKARDAQVNLGKAQKGWESVTVIAPRESRTGEDGVELLPFDGFAISVDSLPEGAKVIAGSEPLGETPLMRSVACAPGAELKLRVERPPLPSREVTVPCRANTLVKIAVRLDGDRPVKAPALAPASR